MFRRRASEERLRGEDGNFREILARTSFMLLKFCFELDDLARDAAKQASRAEHYAATYGPNSLKTSVPSICLQPAPLRSGSGKEISLRSMALPDQTSLNHTQGRRAERSAGNSSPTVRLQQALHYQLSKPILRDRCQKSKTMHLNHLSQQHMVMTLNTPQGPAENPVPAPWIL